MSGICLKSNMGAKRIQMKQNLPWVDNCWSWIMSILVYFHRWFKFSITCLCKKEYSYNSNCSCSPFSLCNCCQTRPWPKVCLYLFWEVQFLQGNSYCFKALVTKSWFFIIFAEHHHWATDFCWRLCLRNTVYKMLAVPEDAATPCLSRSPLGEHRPAIILQWNMCTKSSFW